MKIQLKIIVQVLKNNWKLILTLFFLLLISIIFYLVRPIATITNKNDFLSLICYPKIEMNFINYLLSMFQIGLTIFLIYEYYTYEFNHSFEYTILRTKEKKWLVSKIIWSLIFIVLFKIIYIILAYIYFNNLFSLTFNDLLIPVIYQITITMIIISSINIFYNNKILNFMVIFIFSILLFYFFSVNISLIIIIILIIFNIIYFRFKKLIL